jgi:hypothetical protein
MSDATSSRNILTPESMPVFVVVIGALSLLAVTMNFYNWSLIQGVLGAAIALEHEAVRDNTSGDAAMARLEAVEKDLAATKQALADAQQKMAEMTTMAAGAAPGAAPK